jgi:hypothetical protein
MAETETASPVPEPETPRSVGELAPPPEEVPARGSAQAQVIDLVGLVALLALCAGIYLVVGDAGFSVIIGAVAGLLGSWRMRRH